MKLHKRKLGKETVYEVLSRKLGRRKDAGARVRGLATILKNLNRKKLHRSEQL